MSEQCLQQSESVLVRVVFLTVILHCLHASVFMSFVKTKSGYMNRFKSPRERWGIKPLRPCCSANGALCW